jgi:biotin carboxyl carrier protein
MEKRFNVRVNESFDYEFTKEEIAALDARATTSSTYHVLKDNRSFEAEILHSNFLQREYEVKINSSTYKIEISNELDLLIKEMGLSIGASQVINHIKAPMPGLILDVNVKEGEKVKEGDYLLVLEAMKMENSLTAPRDGVVKSVTVKVGETVEKNQLLIEMEDPGEGKE